VGATEVNETQKWATSKKRLRTTGLDYVGASMSHNPLGLHTCYRDSFTFTSSRGHAYWELFVPTVIKLPLYLLQKHQWTTVILQFCIQIPIFISVHHVQAHTEWILHTIKCQFMISLSKYGNPHIFRQQIPFLQPQYCHILVTRKGVWADNWIY
jgi:hypothetical protein